jgi:SAM-dependent methyltransferase
VSWDDPARRSTRSFFGPRAATWDERFPDDEPAFASAVDALALEPGDVAVDLGCGTGRALPHLRERVGPTGWVVGVDVTVEMVEVAATRGPVVVGDAGRVPLRDGASAGVFAAGLLHHLADPHDGLREWARVTRTGGHLAIFHPIGRAALAARRGHDLSPDDIRDPVNLPTALGASGWELVELDDGDDRYLAIAARTGPQSTT